jgi:hypothetical protein
MSTGQHQVYADLVGGLLDAREDPAVVRFDAELAAAVTRGEVSTETAKRLRVWQRASARGVADHVRAVLPTVLDALESARAEARAQVVDLAAALADDGTTGDPVGDGAGQAGRSHTAEVTLSAVIPTQAAPARDSSERDTPGPASSPPSGGPSSLGAATSRLMVAELVPSRSPVVHDPR